MRRCEEIQYLLKILQLTFQYLGEHPASIPGQLKNSIQVVYLEGLGNGIKGNRGTKSEGILILKHVARIPVVVNLKSGRFIQVPAPA